MWLVIVLGLLLLLLIGLLLIPLRLYINTNSKTYTASVGHLVKAYVEGDPLEIIRIRVRIPGYQFFLYPLKKKDNGKKKIKKKSKPKPSRQKLKKKGKWVLRFLRSFKLKEFWLTIDTGNYVKNAQLYPIFGFINHFYLPCGVNFQGVNCLIVDLRSRPWNIIKSFIHF